MRKLIFALAFGAILLPSHGFALGLGEIDVSSALNQKLAARIDLLSTAPEEAESLLINLGSREEFIRAGLDRPLVLTTLKFKTRTEDGNVYIDVTSPKPIRDPFLNFLLEVDWPKGHLIREYTILLDPPVFMGSRGSQAAPASGRPAMQTADSRAPVAAQSSAAVGTSIPAASAPPVQTYAPAPAPAQAESYAAPAEHRIQAGDTAWSLANSMKPDESVSTQQMLLALLRANPEVFVNENVNGLKRGYILRMPEATDINAVSSEEARALVRQQNAMWREYQQSLVSDEPASAIDEDYRGTESGSAVAGSSDNSRLSIVSAGAGSSAVTEMKSPSEMSASELREQLALARERVETERVEKENLQEQVGSLSKQVDKMKSLLSIEDDALAEIQSVGAPSEEDGDVAAIDDTGEMTADELMAESGDESEALDALMADAETETAEPAVDDEKLFVDETAEPVAETAAEPATAMMDELEPAESDYVQQKETGLIDTLLDNRTLIGGLLLVVLVLGAIVYLVKRRRDNAAGDADDDFGFGAFGASEEDALEDVADSIDAESIDQLVSDEDVKASMAEAKSEEKKFDAEATMILPSGTGTVVTSAAELQAEEPQEEQDDVLAEADVYLAYGIYQQAEELLEAAIAEHPDKDSYRVKLAETYYAGKNAKAFEKLGTEMKQRLGDKETPAWIKVVAMGKELCPDAEIFQQADLDVDLDVNDMMPKSPEPMDFDLGDIEDDSASELDMDFDAPLEESSEEMSFDLPSLEDEASDELEFDLSETDALAAPAELESLDELEFDLGETDALETPAELSFDDDEEEEFSLDIEASELDLEDSSETAEAGLDLDFDMSMDAESEEAAPVSKAEDADSDLDMDFSLDMSEETEAAVDSEEGGEFDLSAEAADFDLSADEDMGGMDLSEPLDADEVNTKLDLARAYLDMGDHEGARDILEEVVAGGNAGQKQEAEELMAQAN